MKLRLTPEQTTLHSEPALGTPSVRHTTYLILCDLGAFSLSPRTALKPKGGRDAPYEATQRPKEAP